MKRLMSIILIGILTLGLSGCSRQQKKVVVASTPQSEQYILAEMIALLIESNTDIEVEKKLGIDGGTSHIHPEMESGEIDIYPEYTGNGWTLVLQEELINNSDELYEAVKKQYLEKYNIKWLDLYGFNDNYALAMKREMADRLGIETYSDLARISHQLVIGVEYEFYEREDGYSSLVETYGFAFKDTKEIDMGLKYDVIGADHVDVINSFSTDGLLKEYDLKVLVDDKNFFPAYYATTLIRKDTLEKYPELEGILNKLAYQINNDEMTLLNYYVEKEYREPVDVAKEFLEEKSLLY